MAISNSRIKNYTSDGMVYDWKDYRHNSVHKRNTMHAVGFSISFRCISFPGLCPHPAYGFSPSNRDKVRKGANSTEATRCPKERGRNPTSRYAGRVGEIGVCPHCKCRMIVIEILKPSRTAL